MTPARFKKIIWDFYAKNRRDFPWRETRDPYKILVSEIMLQQTQAPRIVAKYESFLRAFPHINALATASTADVLREWKGLGYNRRALSLKKAAEIIVRKHGGNVPRDMDALIALPGVGRATAGDVLAFAWNIPAVVIETNIRSVFIHFFFTDSSDNKNSAPSAQKIHDRDIVPLIEKTLDRDNPRDWYYALMDYGAMLKKTHGNASVRSAHYAKQSAFKGSNRELRSKILEMIMKKKQQGPAIVSLITKTFPHTTTESIEKNLVALMKEGFIVEHKGTYSIKK